MRVRWRLRPGREGAVQRASLRMLPMAKSVLPPPPTTLLRPALPCPALPWPPAAPLQEVARKTSLMLRQAPRSTLDLDDQQFIASIDEEYL